MHLPGLFQILVIALIVLVLFGRGKVSEFMGDFGKGVKSFRKGFTDDDEAPRLEAAAPEAESPVQPASDRSRN